MFATVVLATSALMFLGFGVWFLVWPAKGAALVHLQAVDPMGLAELRAFIGGGEIGLAVFLGLALLRPDLKEAGLLLTVAVLLGAAAGRTVSLLADRNGTGQLYWTLAIEVVLGGAALLAWWRLPGAVT